MKDTLGNTQKYYEKHCVSDPLPKHMPIITRIDGRTFSKLTKGLDRPFDLGFSQAMRETTKHLVQASGATVGYTQSDEISLAWLTDRDSEMWFGGKVQKLTSTLAALATIAFNKFLGQYGLEHLREKLPTFDARIWFVPSLEEAQNYFRWRELDATKNSVTMLAREYFSDKDLFKVSTAQKKLMLLDKGVDWETYPDHFKKGSYFSFQEDTRKLGEEELKNLPPKHHARLNPDAEFTRKIIKNLDISAFKDRIL
jgi:tRNA(His) 5'-end guanylyltransferase